MTTFKPNISGLWYFFCGKTYPLDSNEKMSWIIGSIENIRTIVPIFVGTIKKRNPLPCIFRRESDRNQAKVGHGTLANSSS